MALTPSEIASGIALLTAVGAFTAPLWAARPAKAQALTARFTALMDRQAAEIEHAQRQCAALSKEREEWERERRKLETVTTQLEIMVIRLTEWADDAAIELSRRGIDMRPRPGFKDLSS